MPSAAINSAVDRAEQEQGAPLDNEQLDELELWQKGRALAGVPPHAWEVIFEMVDSYADDSMRQLARINPGNVDQVRGQHAVYFGLNQMSIAFRNDVAAAVEASKTPPEFLRKQGPSV